MKLVRGAMLSAVAFAVVASPTLATAAPGAAQKLSISRAHTSGKRNSDLNGPTIPGFVAVALVAGVVAGTVILATEKPDSP